MSKMMRRAAILGLCALPLAGCDDKNRVTQLMLRQAGEGPWTRCLVEVDMRPTLHSRIMAEYE